MNRISNFKLAMSHRNAIKIISGIDNFDMDRVRNVVTAATEGGAHAVDIYQPC